MKKKINYNAGAPPLLPLPLPLPLLNRYMLRNFAFVPNFVFGELFSKFALI